MFPIESNQDILEFIDSYRSSFEYDFAGLVPPRCDMPYGAFTASLAGLMNEVTGKQWLTLTDLRYVLGYPTKEDTSYDDSFIVCLNDGVVLSVWMNRERLMISVKSFEGDTLQIDRYSALNDRIGYNRFPSANSLAKRILKELYTVENINTAHDAYSRFSENARRDAMRIDTLMTVANAFGLDRDLRRNETDNFEANLFNSSYTRIVEIKAGIGEVKLTLHDVTEDQALKIAEILKQK